MKLGIILYIDNHIYLVLLYKFNIAIYTIFLSDLNDSWVYLHAVLRTYIIRTNNYRSFVLKKKEEKKLGQRLSPTIHPPGI